MLNMDGQMKVYVQTENLEAYTAVSLRSCILPLVITKLAKTAVLKASSVTSKSREIKPHLKQVIQIVHGNDKNKDDLIKEVREKVPTLARKSALISNFVRDYCTKTNVEGLKNKRQMVNNDKLEATFGPQEDLNLEQIIASKKANAPPEEARSTRRSVTPNKFTTLN